MWYPSFLLFILACVCASSCAGKVVAGANNVKVEAKVPAFFTFGDSIVDPGNMNFLPALGKGNHLPYGRDFMGGKPTGRFCNGKLATDFIAAGLGVKETVPPFLDPELSAQDLLTGVSFAASGAGYDNLTATVFNVYAMWNQLDLFKNYKARLENMVGKENSSNLIGEAIFMTVAGTDDFITNYYLLPIRNKQFTLAQFTDFVLQICSDFTEEMYKLGARKLAVAGIPPFGCLPFHKTLRLTHSILQKTLCLEESNQVAVSYNTKLKEIIKRLQGRLPGIKIVYVDVYDSLLDMLKFPAKYGFETTNKGCCGTGIIEIGPMCNVYTLMCSDVSKYVFWDAVHLTERTYEIIANLILDKYISKLM